MNNQLMEERKLFLKKSELRKLKKQVESGGKAIIPLRMLQRSLGQIGLCIGKSSLTRTTLRRKRSFVT